MIRLYCVLADISTCQIPRLSRFETRAFRSTKRLSMLTVLFSAAQVTLITISVATIGVSRSHVLLADCSRGGEGRGDRTLEPVTGPACFGRLGGGTSSSSLLSGVPVSDYRQCVSVRCTGSWTERVGAAHCKLPKAGLLPLPPRLFLPPF